MVELELEPKSTGCWSSSWKESRNGIWILLGRLSLGPTRFDSLRVSPGTSSWELSVQWLGILEGTHQEVVSHQEDPWSVMANH